MSEYVFRYADGFGFDGGCYIDGGKSTVGEYYETNDSDHYGTIHEEIVRCRDCRHYYEPENYHPSGNYIRQCCNYFDAYNDEVEPDGFCAWAERKVDGDDR